MTSHATTKELQPVELVWDGKQHPPLSTVPVITRTGQVGPGSRNVVVHGDAVQSLRALAGEPSYRGQARLVYLDPPYNTGKRFNHYNDSMDRASWLTMMRDLMVAARPLLAAEGSIWVHLDDSEVHRMRCVMDEVFGEDRFVTQIVWQKRTSRENRAAFSPNHDHILVYANQGPVAWKATRNTLESSTSRTTKAHDIRTRHDTPKDAILDARGPWMSVPFVAQGTRSGQMYDIVTPTGIVHTPPPGCCWRATKARFDQLVADDMIHWPRGGNGRPRVKKFTTTTDIVPHTIWLADEVGTTDEAKREVQALFGKNRVFDTPKPERILQRIIHIATNPGDLVIDPFAGSGTTAAVAHKMGRNWVTVEVEQATIAQFVEPRLRSVVQGTDDGGASTHTVRVSDQDLPDGVSPEAARRFVTLLNKFATLPGVDLDAVADLRRRAATKETVERTWVGGGGFTLAETH